MASAAQMSTAEHEVYSRGRKHFERGEIDPALEAFSTLLRTRENFADIHVKDFVSRGSQSCGNRLT